MKKEKKFILVVEDDIYYSDLYREKISQSGYDVETALNGAEGMKIARNRKPDLIILDILMPKVDGFDFLREIKADKDLKNVKILVMTNLGQDNDKKQALELGANDYFVKSDLSINKLMDKINENLQ